MASPSTTPELGVASEVGTLRSVIVHRPDLAHERLSPTNCHERHRPPPGPGARAPVADELPRPAVRRRDLGAPGPPGVRRVRRPDARARRGGAAVPRAARRDARGPRRARLAAPAQAAPGGGHDDLLARADGLDDGDAGRGAGHATDRRRDAGRAARRHRRRDRARAAAHRLHPQAAAQPAVHARHERLALRRRVDQLDVLAGPPARDAQRRGRLPLPPALPRRRLSRSGSAASTTTGARRRSRAAT